ncbi:MAG TPA: class I SAM-dependent methyltransferase [Anaeromyxobacteraceae bacterium]|nr:class I SAM-dependent methyltransferase [Anaeromyxobacteraceae bacterium]
MRGVDQIPWVYDAFMAAAEWRGLGRWRRWLAGGARGRVLDLGCGTGRDLPLYSAGVRTVAVDPHPQNLRAARRRAPRVPLVQGRAEALPFKDGAFDTVVSGLVLCSVADPALALNEVRRVLAPGGALRMLEHVRSRHRAWGRVQDLVQPAWTRFAGGCHPNRDTERAVEAAGFAIEADGRRERGTLRRFQARVRTGDG